MKKEKSNKEAVIKELSEHIDAIFSPLIAAGMSLQRELESILKKEEEPLPCPFCGSECKVFIDPNSCATSSDNADFLISYNYYVECDNGHSLRKMSNTKEEAIKKWNERV